MGTRCTALRCGIRPFSLAFSSWCPRSDLRAAVVRRWVDDVQFYACNDSDCSPTCTDSDLPLSCRAVEGVPANCWPQGTGCPIVPTLANHLVGGWGYGRDDVWAVGALDFKSGGIVTRWNAVKWSTVPSGSTPGLWGVWGRGPNDAWAVGDRGTTLHWDGAAWSPVFTGTTEGLRSIWGSGPNDVWAVGHLGTILHWDGTAWSNVGMSDKSERLWLSSVAGSGTDDVWAVGISELEGTRPTIGLILHWDGRNWSTPSGVPQPVWGVWSNGLTDAWAVGRRIFHWDGAVWGDVPSPIETSVGTLTAVWGSAGNDVGAVGSGGTILHWDGTAWRMVFSDGPSDLYGIWGTGRDNVWAFGARGTILHWNGAVWVPW